MSEIQFDENQDIESQAAYQAGQESKPSFLTSLAFKTGLVETEHGAQVLLLIISVLCILGAIIVNFGGDLFGSSSHYVPGPNTPLPPGGFIPPP